MIRVNFDSKLDISKKYIKSNAVMLEKKSSGFSYLGLLYDDIVIVLDSQNGVDRTLEFEADDLYIGLEDSNEDYIIVAEVDVEIYVTKCG